LRAGIRVGEDAGVTQGSWATAEGEDAYGRWAEATVAGVVFRMRWVPPGQCVMGSPKTEAGHDTEQESPQHTVVLTGGFWLGETPVTQALWTAVMKKNPSLFQDDARPVEKVSWTDCDKFVKRVNKKVVGLDLRLPREHEWEYACRAGSTTATWAGDLEILGEKHAPVLDAIAWYGGNSGHGFELATGDDATGWAAKQYPHTKAGTRRVGTRAANPFGLYDMLGNVREWCADWWVDYYYAAASAVDPPLPEAGVGRVLRGGCWFDDARDVRAAARARGTPGFRNAGYGFRLARDGQG